MAANLAGGKEGLVGYLKKQAELVNPSAFMTGLSKLLPSMLEGNPEAPLIVERFTTLEPVTHYPFHPKAGWAVCVVPTPAPLTKLVMPVTKVRTGCPPLGQVAMTAAERQRRRRAALKSGEAAGRKKEPVAAHPQKSNRAIAAQNDFNFPNHNKS